MGRVLIVSNRLPFTITRRKDKITLKLSIGGVATGLRGIYQKYNSLWIGWSGLMKERINEEERRKLEEKILDENNCYPIFLPQEEVAKYYYGFCNRTLWPLCHYFTQYVVYNKTFWDSYCRVNEIFAKEVSKFVKKGDIIWIHDYHLMLLPQILRERFPDALIGFFFHIPFPSFEIFRLLPWKKELLEGMLGADMIGFHVYEYVRHFFSSVYRILNYEAKWEEIITPEGTIEVDTFPMGIDYSHFSKAIEREDVKREVERFKKKIGSNKIILSIDRLDYTKGIKERLIGFHAFLKAHPEYKEKINLIINTVPSRRELERYKLLKKEIEELISKINGEFSTIGWVPIWYFHQELHSPLLEALYIIADVALITPLRDGMNLMAKEFITTKKNGKGVLILSEMAGTSKELREAIIINPNDVEGFVQAMEKAFQIPEEEQIAKNKKMQKRLKKYDVEWWASEFIKRLKERKRKREKRYARMLTEKEIKDIVKDYRKSKSRLLFLDYDGTLVEFFDTPEEAKPNKRILTIFKKLIQDKKNEIILISGRKKETLEKWFSSLGIKLVAEHGAWVKEKEWLKVSKVEQIEWKEDLKGLFQLYVNRTPNSFIEEKEFSITWHYRKVEADLGIIRAKELSERVKDLCVNFNLEIIEGDKVIEVKHREIFKGKIVEKWMNKREWDFILVIGDDSTDEEMFKVCNDKVYSIKVGMKPSIAKFKIQSPEEVRKLLERLIEDDKKITYS
jgi:trehalose 6-phosphate synthase/phosphatase